MDTRIAQAPPAELARIDTSPWTAPFWAAAADHRLVVARCADCGQYRMPPTPFCPNCRSQRIDWTQITGDGTLYSYTIVERAIIPDMTGNLPYVPAIIAFAQAGGVRLISNIVGSRLCDLRVDARVVLHWREVGDGLALPVFGMATEGGEEG